ncbi:serine/threonine-protein kinase [Actinomadura rugatobispora]|uniref:serine/threonine-protein kinase n=1 Tax=Actinomadura rugatobispora TaxID=1994 RepID=UPI00366BE2C6
MRESPTYDVRPLEAGDPRTVGGYSLLGRIGAGGMGTVYLGRRSDSDRRVAVKTIHPHLAVDAAFRDRFRDEAVLAGRVASFCTARVLAHGEEDGRPYIVSEYVGGMSLQHRITAGGPMPDADAHAVAVGVVSALAAIHSAGLVHRDLKPANVMLTLSGCRVIDFGIARSQDTPGTLTSAGTVLGTPGWMAPEVLRGGYATPAADIFTWGCLVAYAGTGRMPFGEGEPAAVALRVMREEPDLDGLPVALLNAVRPALAKDPRDRPTASGLLLALVQGTGRPAPAPSATAALPRREARKAARNGGAARNGTVPRTSPRNNARNGAGNGGKALGRPVAAPPRPASSSGAGDEGPDTAAFTVIGHVGARSSTRVRLLAGVGAAVATLLAGGLIIGMSGAGRDAVPASSTSATPPSAPASGTTSRAPVRRVVPVTPRPSKRHPGQRQSRDQKGKNKGEGKTGGRNRGSGAP